MTKKLYRDKIIAIAGFPIDAKYREWMYGDSGYWSNRDILEIVHTTQWKMARGHTPVVKVGHADQEQALKGEILRVRSGFVEVPTLTKGTVKRLCLKADMEIEYPFFDLIDKGRFPNVSVEAYPAGGVTNTGEKLGSFLSGVALLGKDMPAIQDMPRLYSVGGTNYYRKGQGNTMGIFRKVFGSTQKRETEKKKYDAEQMMELAEELKAIAETIVDPAEAKDAVIAVAAKIEEYMAEIMDSEGEPEPAPEETESTKTDSDDEEEMKSATAAERSLKKQIATMTTQMTEMKSTFESVIASAKAESEAEKKAAFDAEMTIAFAGLVEKGILVKQEESRFKRDCTADGIEKTLAYYSGKGNIHKTPLDVTKIKNLTPVLDANEIPATFRAANYDRYLQMAHGNKDKAEALLKAAWAGESQLKPALENQRELIGVK